MSSKSVIREARTRGVCFSHASGDVYWDLLDSLWQMESVNQFWLAGLLSTTQLGHKLRRASFEQHACNKHCTSGSHEN